MARKPKRCKVEPNGSLWHVVDHDGTVLDIVGGVDNRHGFPNKRDAEHIAAMINARREAKPNG